MTDIVERLRAYPHVNGAVLAPAGLFAEAADEIDRLRVLLLRAEKCINDLTEELKTRVSDVRTA